MCKYIVPKLYKFLKFTLSLLAVQVKTVTEQNPGLNLIIFEKLSLIVVYTYACI